METNKENAPVENKPDQEEKPAAPRLVVTISLQPETGDLQIIGHLANKKIVIQMLCDAIKSVHSANPVTVPQPLIKADGFPPSTLKKLKEKFLGKNT